MLPHQLSALLPVCLDTGLLSSRSTTSNALSLARHVDESVWPPLDHACVFRRTRLLAITLICYNHQMIALAALESLRTVAPLNPLWEQRGVHKGRQKRSLESKLRIDRTSPPQHTQSSNRDDILRLHPFPLQPKQ